MEPILKDGEMVSVKPYNNQQLIIGDIIVYKKFRTHLTIHRIINIIQLNNKRFYCLTKGDNNPNVDNYVVFNHEIIGFIDRKE